MIWPQKVYNPGVNQLKKSTPSDEPLVARLEEFRKKTQRHDEIDVVSPQSAREAEHG
jgi:hypothetical protein